MARSFHGSRVDGECMVTYKLKPLPRCLHIRNHSPDGFNWGYVGSGPAQLALAILVAALGRRRAEKSYQDFKRQVIAKIDHNEWTMSYEKVYEWWRNWDASDRLKRSVQNELFQDPPQIERGTL